LQHVRDEGSDDEDVKFIGVYSSEASALAAIERLKKQPGFVDYPAGFGIDRYEIDQDQWSEGFVS
jgi:hypothetical protein